MTSASIDWCARLRSAREFSSESDIPDELQDLVIVIEGDQISGSIDYLVAQSITQLQLILYKIAAHALYGENATVKNLNEADLEKFKLSFVRKCVIFCVQ